MAECNDDSVVVQMEESWQSIIDRSNIYPRENDGMSREDNEVALITHNYKQDTEVFIQEIKEYDDPCFQNNSNLFQYSMFGKSGLASSSSFLYGSHHSSGSDWLDSKKLSVALVGSDKLPNLPLFAPTAKEIEFVGQLTCPATAFYVVRQMPFLEKITFNLGIAGYSPEYMETGHYDIPASRNVTSLEVKMDPNLYRTCNRTQRATFEFILADILKMSGMAFPNLSQIYVDVPKTRRINTAALKLLHDLKLRDLFQFSVTAHRIIILRKTSLSPYALPYYPFNSPLISAC